MFGSQNIFARRETGSSIPQNWKLYISISLEFNVKFLQDGAMLHSYQISGDGIREENCQFIFNQIIENEKKYSGNKHQISIQFKDDIGICKMDHVHDYLKKIPQDFMKEFIMHSPQNESHINAVELFKLDWKNIEKIHLYQSRIENEGCLSLLKSNWHNLKQVNLISDKITHEGCKYLSKTKWPYLKTLNLSYNKIGDIGCKYLATSQWSELEKISLDSNSINERGCRYLSKAIWPKLKQISLSQNQINGNGYHWIAKGYWPQIQKLNLNYFKGTYQIRLYRSQANYIQMRELSKILLKQTYSGSGQYKNQKNIQKAIKIKRSLKNSPTQNNQKATQKIIFRNDNIFYQSKADVSNIFSRNKLNQPAQNQKAETSNPQTQDVNRRTNTNNQSKPNNELNQQL